MKHYFFLFLGCFIASFAFALNTPSLNLVKRGFKSCQGVCDEANLVCSKNKELRDWCQKHCQHKINMDEVCAHKKTFTQGLCKKSPSKKRREDASVAARFVYKFKGKKPVPDPSFTFVASKKSRSTELVAWSGVKDCVLYVAYRGTVNKGDLVKDLQIGVAHVGHTLARLGDGLSRGLYNESLKKSVDFYHHAIKKAEGHFQHVVITGHSLGGAFAQNVSQRVGRENPHVELITFNAPGANFNTPIGTYDVKKGLKTTHVRNQHDLVSLWGQTTHGKQKVLPGHTINPLESHHMQSLVDQLKKK